MKRPRWMWRIAMAVLVSTSFPSAARAQQPAPSPPVPPPPSPIAAAPAAGPPPEPAPPPPAPVVVAPSSPPPPAVAIEAPPAPPPAAVVPAKPAINMTIAARAGLKLQDPNQPKDMSEVHLDNSYNAAELRLSGDVTEEFGITTSFNVALPGSGGQLAGKEGAVGIMDLIAQYKAAKEFNIWLGRLLVPSDRSNFSGPFFMSPWNYPGFYIAGAPPLGPKDNATGRDQGITVWGNAIEDKLKYYVGAYGIDVTTRGAQPYYSGRISYSLQGSEPGYFGSSTYYGAQNVVTIGVGAQYQKSGSSIDPVTRAAKETFLFMADILAEENVPGAGTFTLEGQFYKFNDGYQFAGPMSLTPSVAFYVLASYLTPQPIGIGKLQPLVRWQQTTETTLGAVKIPAWTIVDAGLSYVIKDYFCKLALTYQHTDLGAPNTTANSLQFGVQVQKF